MLKIAEEESASQWDNILFCPRILTPTTVPMSHQEALLGLSTKRYIFSSLKCWPEPTSTFSGTFGPFHSLCKVPLPAMRLLVHHVVGLHAILTQTAWPFLFLFSVSSPEEC